MAGRLMQRAWYEVMRQYVKAGLHFFFRKIEVHGLENIPEGGIIFTPNHQNALVDALLLICHTPHQTYSLTRASIFKKKAVAWLLGTFNMLPVFRVRDGMKTVANNNDIFSRCCRLVAEGGALLIFPEGDHNMKRRVPPLSKGFTRIAFGAKKLAGSSPVHVVPVSINYSQHERSGSVVSIHIGRAIDVASYMPEHDEAEHGQALLLREAVSLGIAENLVQIPEPYAENEAFLKNIIGDKIIDPAFVKTCFDANGQPLPISNPQPQKVGAKSGKTLGKWINIIPIALLRFLVTKLTKERIFYATLKVGLGIFLFPLVYLVEWKLLELLIGPSAIWVWPVSVLGVYAYTKG